MAAHYARRHVTSVMRTRPEKQRGDTAHYNRYFNAMLASPEIRNGWILFLDDDDVLSGPQSLRRAAQETVDEDTLYIFRMRRMSNGKVKPKPGTTGLVCGQVGTPCIVFHTKWRGAAKWGGKTFSDYGFAVDLSKKIPRIKFCAHVIAHVSKRNKGKPITI